MDRFDAVLSTRIHPGGRGLRERLRSSEELLINKGARRQMRRRWRFEWEVQDLVDLALVHLKGELDISQVHRLEAVGLRGPRPVVVDLSELTFIDLAGYRYLVSAKDQADGRGQQFVLTGASGAVQRLFALMGTEQLLSEPDEPAFAC